MAVGSTATSPASVCTTTDGQAGSQAQQGAWPAGHGASAGRRAWPGPGQPGHLGDLVIVVGGAHPGDRHAGGPGQVLEPVRAGPGELAAVGDQQPHPRLRRQHRVPRCGDLAEQRVELVLVLPGQPQPLLVCLPVLGYLLAQRRSREGAVSLFRPVRRGCGGSSRWADRCCRCLDGWPGAAGRRCG